MINPLHIRDAKAALKITPEDEQKAMQIPPHGIKRRAVASPVCTLF